MSLSVKIDMNSGELDALVKKLEFMTKYESIDKAVRAMAKPVLTRAKPLAPRSEKTGTRLKWGKRKTKHFNPETWRRDTSADHLSYKTIKMPFGALLKVGAKSPYGGKQRFNQGPNGRRQFFWGRDTGKIYRPPFRFMHKAWDESRPEAIAALVAKLKDIIKEQGLG